MSFFGLLEFHSATTEVFFEFNPDHSILVLNSDWQWVVADVESGPRKVPTPAASRLQIELRRPSSSAGAPAPVLPKETIVADSGVESSKEKKEKKFEQAEGSAVITGGGEDSGGAIEGPPSKEDVAAVSVGKEQVGVSVREEEEKPGYLNDEGETGMISKNIEPPSVKEAEGVAVESEISKGVFSLRNDTFFIRILGCRIRVLFLKVDVVGLIHFETFICTTPMLDTAVQKEGSLSLSLLLFCFFDILYNIC